MLEHHLFYGLKNSDAYVWVYVEQARWWDEQNISPRLEPLVKRAKSSVATETREFDPEFIEVAEEAFNARVSIGGSITPNVPDVTLSVEGLPDTACNVYNNGGKYSCTFPAGSSVSVTPVAEGVTFQPLSYTYRDIVGEFAPH